MAFYIEERRLRVIDPEGDTVVALWGRTSIGRFALRDNHPKDVLAPEAPMETGLLRNPLEGPPCLFKCAGGKLAAFGHFREILLCRDVTPVRQQGYWILEISGYNMQGFETVLRMAHEEDFVGGTVNRFRLAEFAMIQENLDCQKLFAPFVDLWLQGMRNFPPPLDYGEELVLDLVILAKFRDTDLLQKAAWAAILYCRGEINGQGEELPIPTALTQIIERTRRAIIGEIRGHIEHFRLSLHDTGTTPVPVVDFYDFECCADHHDKAYNVARNILGRAEKKWLREPREHTSVHSILRAIKGMESGDCAQGYICSTNFAVGSIRDTIMARFDNEDFWTDFWNRVRWREAELNHQINYEHPEDELDDAEFEEQLENRVQAWLIGHEEYEPIVEHEPVQGYQPMEAEYHSLDQVYYPMDEEHFLLLAERFDPMYWEEDEQLPPWRMARNDGEPAGMAEDFNHVQPAGIEEYFDDGGPAEMEGILNNGEHAGMEENLGYEQPAGIEEHFNDGGPSEMERVLNNGEYVGMEGNLSDGGSTSMEVCSNGN